jgi:hypothetical protein
MIYVLIIWVICAIIAVLDRMDKGSAYIFKHINTPTEEDIIFEYIYIALLSPIILFNKYIK